MSSYKLLNSFEFPPFTSSSRSIENEALPEFTQRGFIFKSQYVWQTKGATLEVICPKTQQKICRWTFGHILNDNTVRITCTEEIPRQNRLPYLAIGLQSNIIGGVICIFDIAVSKVVRAIDVKDNVTNIHFVETENESVPLPGPLRAFDGVLAVGLSGGDVLLIDLCRQLLGEVLSGNLDVKDELNPSQVVILHNKDVPRVEHYKEKSVRKGFHLAIHLNYAGGDLSPHFKLKASNGDTIVLVNRIEVAVSAMHYCPQLGSLLVGYNFGALQLWDLINMKLVYTSPVYEKNIPVSHFAVQEPSDDPKAFCYIWAVYSNTEPFIEDFPVAALYSFTYTTKEFHEGYGYLYEGFVSCQVRFQMDLMMPDDYVPSKKPRGAWCVALEALNKNRNCLVELPDDTLVICCFTWMVWCSEAETLSYQCVFDLNQWYKEQMPGEPRWEDCENYLMYKRICEVFPKESGIILDVAVVPSSITQFMGVQRLEEHYYPSSLSFDFKVLRDTDFSQIAMKGVQKTFLQQLQSAGPLALIQPFKPYQEAVRLGLSPLFVDTATHQSVNLTTEQRRLLLSVLLEEQMLKLLCNCASDWANGSYSSAHCTLDLLLAWAWERAITLKQNADGLCVSLFDYSGVKLDGNSQKIVSSCCRQLSNLCIFYDYVLEKLQPFVNDPALVQRQCEKLRMVSVYFEVLQWLINVKLLPECSSDTLDNDDSGMVPYPIDTIANYYTQRRTELSKLSEKYFRENVSLLFIDNLIEQHCGGVTLQREWQKEEGDGLYPPPSLQSLLRTYLLEGTEIPHKHCLVIYLFLDLAVLLNQDRYAETVTLLIKFPAVFKLSQSLIKITQAFWHLDHEDFSTALEYLLDPLVLDGHLEPWHHRIVLKAFLVHEQYTFGLLYLKTSNPPLSTEEDFKLAVSFHVANSMIDNAFTLLRRNGCSKPNDKILTHLFAECIRFEKIHEVLKHPVTENEENSFFAYLEAIRHPHAYDIRISYNMLKSRFLDAYELNTKAHLDKFTPGGLSGQENAELRDTVISTYKDLMPDVGQRLLSVCQKERAGGLWKEVPKPQPMSVFVHNTAAQVKYKSTLIIASLSKARETWTRPLPAKNPGSILKTEEIPFLRTPKVDLKEKRKMTPMVVEPVVIGSEASEEEGPSPPKRARFKTLCETYMVQLDTPVVIRKTPRSSSRFSRDGVVCTPQSILKVGNLARKLSGSVPARGESTTPEDLTELPDSTPKPTEESAVRKKFSLGLTPRRTISRSDSPAVRFSGLISLSSANTSGTTRTSGSLVEDRGVSAEETFHSLDSSNGADAKPTEVPKNGEPLKVSDTPKSFTNLEKQPEPEEDDESAASKTKNDASKFSTPKARRSLHTSITSSPLRQSPRLHRQTQSDVNTPSDWTPVSTPSPVRVPVSRRRSLKQKVLTNNALRAFTPREQVVETSYSKVDTVRTTIKTAEGVEVTSVVEKEDMKKKIQDYSGLFSDDGGSFGVDSPYKDLNVTDSIFFSDTDIETEEGVRKITETGKDSEASQDSGPSRVENPAEIETSYSKVDTVSTRIETGEESTVMEEMKKKTHESSSLFSDDGDSFKVDSRYENLNVTDSIFFSETEEVQTDEGIRKITGSDRNETGKDPAFNVYDASQDSAPGCTGNRPEIETREGTVLTEMPIMSLEQYSAMEENDFDELHEECFDEEVIERQYLSGAGPKAVAGDGVPGRNVTVISDVIEIGSSSSASESEKAGSADSSEADSGSSSDGSVKAQSESEEDGTSESSEEVNVEDAAEKDEDRQELEIEVEENAGEDSSSEVEEANEDLGENRKEIEECRLEKNEDEQNIAAAVVVCKVDTIPVEEQKVEAIYVEIEEQEIRAVDVEDDISSKLKAVQRLPEAQQETLMAEEKQADTITEDQVENKEVQEASTSRSVAQERSDLDYSVLSATARDTFYRTDLSYSLETPNETCASKSDLEFSVITEGTFHSTPLAESSRVTVGNITGELPHSTPKRVRRSTRSQSAEPQDLPPAVAVTRRSSLRKRSASVDVTQVGGEVSGRKGRLPAIVEEKEMGGPKRRKPVKKALSTSDVLETRRVTRSMRGLLGGRGFRPVAGIEEVSSESEGEERGPKLAPIDPMKLLDKQSFKGEPDPEEAKAAFRRSPSSFSRTSSKSETSESRKRPFTKAKTASPPAPAMRTRSRTKSMDVEASEQKQTKTRTSPGGKDGSESGASGVSTRSKTVRGTSAASDTSVGGRKKGAPKKSKRGLEKINE